jgi:hypothetical protein
MGRLSRLGPLAGIVLLLTACATRPQVKEQGPLDLLPSGDGAFLSASGATAQALLLPVLGIRLSDAEEKRFFDRTDRVFAGFGKGSGSPGVFHAVAAGDYPSSLFGLVFSKKRGFDKRREPYLHWEQRGGGLKVAAIGGDYLLLSNGTAGEMLSVIGKGRSSLPDRVREAFLVSDLAVYLPEASEYLSDQFRGLPLSALFAEFSADGTGGYLLSLRAGTGSEQEARLFTSLGKLLLLKRAKERGSDAVLRLMKEVVFAAEGSEVLVTGVTLTEDEVRVLIRTAFGEGGGI